MFWSEPVERLLEKDEHGEERILGIMSLGALQIKHKLAGLSRKDRDTVLMVQDRRGNSILHKMIIDTQGWGIVVDFLNDGTFTSNDLTRTVNHRGMTPFNYLHRRCIATVANQRLIPDLPAWVSNMMTEHQKTIDNHNKLCSEIVRSIRPDSVNHVWDHDERCFKRVEHTKNISCLKSNVNSNHPVLVELQRAASNSENPAHLVEMFVALYTDESTSCQYKGCVQDVCVARRNRIAAQHAFLMCCLHIPVLRPRYHASCIRFDILRFAGIMFTPTMRMNEMTFLTFASMSNELVSTWNGMHMTMAALH